MDSKDVEKIVNAINTISLTLDMTNERLDEIIKRME